MSQICVDKLICRIVEGFHLSFPLLHSWCLINIPPRFCFLSRPDWTHSPWIHRSPKHTSWGHFSLISYCLKLWIIKMFYKCFMGTSSTQSTTNMKSKIQGRRKENICIRNNFHYRQVFICVPLKTFLHSLFLRGSIYSWNNILCRFSSNEMFSEIIIHLISWITY